MIRFAALVFALALAAPAAGADRLLVGTWNLEWMMTPETFDALAARCLASDRRAGGSERAIPCDQVPGGRWSENDLARLRAFAADADLDVIALQEIDGFEVARRIFPQHVFCFTSRHHVQNVGFAVRRGIPHRCDRDYRALGLADDDVRRGADLTLYPGTERAIRLLSVHLKSSCNRDPLTDPRHDCQVLQQQLPVLEDWIDRRARTGRAFAVIGDFNRRFDLEQAARDASGRIVAMWPEIDDGDPPDADLTNAGAEHGAITCGNRYGPSMPIDFFVLSRKLSRALVPGSYRAWNYPRGRRWPDHCLLSIELEPERLDGL